MPVAAFAAALALAAGTDPGPGASPRRVEAAVLAALLAEPAGGARASAATRPLVASPYVASPLGEGEGPDPDPRFRLDAFDCWTFVETAVALASSSSLEEARAALDDVRYSGAPALSSRNHEVLSQWIPGNASKGWVSDAGPDVAGPLARPAWKEYTADSWAAVFRAGRGIRGLPRSRLPSGRFGVHVVSIADVPAVAGRVADGTIVLVVRADAPDRATRVSHAGLVVAGPGGHRIVRHATSTRGVERVIEEPIERFVKREEQALPRWPIDGLAFLAIRANEARVHSLASAASSGPAPGRRAVAPRRAPTAGR